MSLKNIFLSFLFFTIYNFTFSQCPNGDVYLYYQSDVEKFIEDYGNCEVIGGSIFIGRNITDISGITSIKRIEGSLSITYSDVPDISNFSALEFIGGNFEVEETINLQSIEGLNKLHSVGGNFHLIRNYALKITKGFNALDKVGGNFVISVNPLLEKIEAFDNLTHTSGWFQIAQNGLKEISGFNKLQKIGIQYDVSYYDGNFAIESNDALTEINGFNSLTEVVRNVDIAANKSLKKIVGFTNLKATRGVHIGGSTDLFEIPDFHRLTSVEFIEIVRTGLTVFNSFNNVIELKGNLYFMNNEVLHSISGFNKLTKISALDITHNTGLKSLIGFSNLVSSTGINIQQNNSLENLKGFEKLFTVGILTGNAISIVGNDSLSDCSVLCNLLKNGNIIGSVSIGNNPSKCSSEAEVRATCIPGCDGDAILGAGHDASVKICFDSISIDLFEELQGNPDLGGTWAPELKSGSSIFDPSIDSSGIYTYTIDNGKCGIATAEVEVVVGRPNNSGENAGIHFCKNNSPVTLLDVLNGNPEPGGTWTFNSYVVSGIFDPAQDPAGTYTYTVENGICAPKSSQMTITVTDVPNAGENGSILISSNSEPVNLFDSLEGNPDPGGEWSPGLSQGNGMFDPKRDIEGIYTYSVGNDRCGIASAEVMVTVNLLPNAGLDGSVEICQNAAGIDLFEILTGNPDSGGNWSPTVGSGNGIFNPLTDQEGIYTYTVTNVNGDKDSSEVKVKVNSIPNSGENASLQVCVNAGPMNLFESLAGNPQAGGVWTPALSSGDGMFDPVIDGAGVYNYTVSGKNCGDSASQVFVTKIEYQAIDNYLIKVEEFSENNSIEILIRSDLVYEYSLDGINYQSNALFTRLPGGLYTVYVRETDGCGRLQTKVAVLDYLKYFTPNNDGYHDTWNLKGISNHKLSTIKIYDRFGKLLKTIDPMGSGWDGTLNGKLMPADDYWFEVVISDQVIKTGHFSLIR